MPNPIDSSVGSPLNVVMPEDLPSKLPIPPGLEEYNNILGRLSGEEITPSNVKDAVSLSLDKTNPDTLKILSDVMSNPTFKPSPSKPLMFRGYSAKQSSRYERDPELYAKVGFNPELPNDIMDAQYDFHESSFESLQSVFAKMWNTTKFQYGNYFMEYADVLSNVHKLDLAVLANQPRFQEYVKGMEALEDLYPDYKTDKPTKWYELYRGDYWEEAGQSIGFTLGTIGAALTETAAISAATEGIGAVPALFKNARTAYKAISDYYNIKKIYNTIKGGIAAKNIGKTLQGIGQGYRIMNGALSESTLEGAMAKNDFVESQTQDFFRKNGRLPNSEELKRINAAGDNIARRTIQFETPFLMASNFVQFGNMVAPKSFEKLAATSLGRILGISKNEAKLVVKGLEAAVEEPVKRQGIKGALMAVGSGLKNTSWEGVEESYQALVTKSVTDYYKDIYQGKDSDLLGSLGAGFDYVLSNEGLKEFTAGLATGAIFQHIRKPFDILARPKQAVDEQGNKVEIDGVPQYKENFLNKAFGLGMDKIQKERYIANLKKTAAFLNAQGIADIFKTDGFLDFIKDRRTQYVAGKFIDKNDIFNLKNAQNIQLLRFLYNGLQTGKIDLQIEKMKNLASMDFETLANTLQIDKEEYLTPESQEQLMSSIKNFSSNLQENSKEFEKIFENQKKLIQSDFEVAATAYSNAKDKYDSFLLTLPKNDKGEVDVDNLDPAIFNELQEIYGEFNLHQIAMIGLTEMHKASVFSQANMLNAAKEAKKILSKLNDKSLSSDPYDLNSKADYSFLEDIFFLGNTKPLIDNLTKRLQIETNEDRKNYIEEALSRLDNIKTLVEKKQYPIEELADEIQGYVEASIKTQGSWENTAPLSRRVEDFNRSKRDDLIDYLKYQKNYQDNLDLNNFLATGNTKYIRFNDQIANFLVPLAKEFAKSKEKEEQAEEDLKKAEEKLQTAEEQPQTQEEPTKEETPEINPDENTLKTFINALDSNDKDTADQLEQAVGNMDKGFVRGYLQKEYPKLANPAVVRKAISTIFNEDLLPEPSEGEKNSQAYKDIYGTKEKAPESKPEVKIEDVGDSYDIKYNNQTYAVFKDEPDLFWIEDENEQINPIKNEDVPKIVKDEFQRFINNIPPAGKSPEDIAKDGKIEEFKKAEPLEDTPEVGDNDSINIPPSDGDKDFFEFPQKDSEENIISHFVDLSRQQGEIATVTVNPQELAEGGGLTTESDKLARKQHYILEKIAENPQPIKLKFELLTDENKKFSLETKFTTIPEIVAFLADEQGNYLYFNDKGDIVEKEEGTIHGFRFEFELFTKANLNISRSSKITKKPGSIKSGFKSDKDPQTLLYEALHNKVPILGTVGYILAGRLLTSNLEDNSFASGGAKWENMRTVQQMVDDNDITEQDFDVKIDGYTVDYVRGSWDSGPNNDGSLTQRIKIGRPYIYDIPSKLYIPLQGTSLREMVFDNGEKITSDTRLYGAIQVLSDKGVLRLEDEYKGNKLFENSDEYLEFFSFLRTFAYSKYANIHFNSDGNIEIKFNTSVPGRGGLWDMEINYSRGLFDTFELKIPLSNNATISAQNFLYNNFRSGAIKAKVGPSDTRFVKINKRLLFKLDLNEDGLISVQNVKEPTSGVNEDNLEVGLYQLKKDPSIKIRVSSIKGNTIELEDGQQMPKKVLMENYVKVEEKKEIIRTTIQTEVANKIKTYHKQAQTFANKAGKARFRASNIVRPFEEIKSLDPNIYINLGTAVDEIFKMVTNGEIPNLDTQFIVGNSKVKLSSIMTADTLTRYIKNFQNIIDQLSDEYYLIPAVKTFMEFNTERFTHGEVDVIGIDKNGNVKVFDVKVTSDKLTKPGKYGNITKLENYATQLHIYRESLKKAGFSVDPISTLINFTYTTVLKAQNDNNLLPVAPSNLNVDYIDLKESDLPDIYRGKTVLGITYAYDFTISQLNIASSYESIREATIKIDENNTGIPEQPTFGNKDEVEPLEMVFNNRYEEIDWGKMKPQLEHVQRMFKGKFKYRLSAMVHDKTAAYWTTQGTTFYKRFLDGVAYHEGWHEFSQLYLTREQKNILYTSIQKEAIPYIDEKGNARNTKDSTFMEIEEFLAYEFMRFAKDPASYSFPKNPEKYKGIKGIFQRLWDFIKFIFNYRPLAERYFNDLYNGSIEKYTRSVSNVMFSGLNAGIYDRDGNNIILPSRIPLYIKSVDGIVSDLLRKMGLAPNFLRVLKRPETLKSNVRRALQDAHEKILKEFSYPESKYTYYMDAINNDEESIVNRTAKINGLNIDYVRQRINTAKEMDNLLEENNFNIFYDAYLSRSSIQALRDIIVNNPTPLEDKTIQDIEKEVNELDDTFIEVIDGDMDEIGSETESKKTSTYNKGANDEDAFDKASKQIKDYFLSLPQVDSIDSNGNFVFKYNELGLKELVDSKTMFNNVKEMLKNTRTIEDMILVLKSEAFVKKFPQARFIANDLETLSSKIDNAENFAFINSFTNIMSLPHITNYELFVDYDRNPDKHKLVASVGELNRRGINKKLAKWRSNFNAVKLDKETGTINDELTLNKLKTDTSLKNLVYNIDGILRLNPFFPFSEVADEKEFFRYIGIELSEEFWDSELSSTARELFNFMIKNFQIYRSYLDTVMANVSDLVDFQKIASNEDKEAAYSRKKAIRSFLMGHTFDKINNKEVNPVYITKIDNPIGFFKDRKYIDFKGSVYEIYSLMKNFSDLIKIDSRFAIENLNSSYVSGDGKTKYPAYEKSLITERTHFLNSVRNVKDFDFQEELSPINPNKKTYLQRTLFYKLMFDKDGNRNNYWFGKKETFQKVKIELSDLSSFRFKQSGLYQTVHPNDLNEHDRVFFDILMFLESGKFEIPRAADSSTAFAFGLNNYGSRQHGIGQKEVYMAITPAEASMTKDEITGKKLQQIFGDYFLMELEKIQYYKKNESKYKDKIKFNIFDGIIENPGEILDKIGKKSIDDIFTEHKEGVFKNLAEYFTNIINELEKGNDGVNLKNLSSRQISILKNVHVRGANVETVTNDDTSKKMSEQEIEETKKQTATVGSDVNTALPSIAKLYVLNHFINRVEYYSWVLGDAGSFDNVFKRGKASTNTGTQIIITPSINKELNKLSEKSLGALKGFKQKDFRKLTSWTIKEMKLNSPYIASIDRNMENYRKQTGSDIKIETEQYNDIKVGNGQAKMSLDSYRIMKTLHNAWSPSDENEYNRQVAIYRKHHGLYEEGESGDLLRKQDEELIKTPFKGFNPLKMSHTGPYIFTDESHPLETSFDKMSLEVLIPEFLLGTGYGDEAVMEQLIENNGDYVKFQTVEKGVKGEVINFFKEDGTHDKKNGILHSGNASVFLRSNFKTQLSTDQFKKTNIVGIQQKNSLFDVKYTKELLSDPVEYAKILKNEENYHQAFENLMYYKSQVLYNQIGVRIKNGKATLISEERFSSFLKKMAKQGKLPNNVLDALDLNEQTGEYNLDFSKLFSRARLMKSIGGIIDEETRILRLPGTAAIQVTAAGKSLFRNASVEELQQYRETGERLQYYDFVYDKEGNIVSTSPMGIKITLQGDFKNLLNLEYNGKKIKTLDNLNKAIKNKEWKAKHMDKLMVYAYRIPTNNNNFIDVGEIMEFLPESAGNIIITPPEYIVKTGSDFDIDKSNLIFPSIRKDGSLYDSKTKARNINQIFADINAITSDISEYSRMQSEIANFNRQFTKDLKQLDKFEETLMQVILFDLSQIDKDNFDRVYNRSNGIFNEIVNNYKEEIELDDTLSSYMRTLKTLQEKISEYSQKPRKNVDKRFEGLLEELSVYYKSNSNDVLKSSIDTVLNKHYYPLLVNPSSTKNMRAVIEKIQKLTKREIIEPNALTGSQKISYLIEQKIHRDYNVHQGSLGLYAIMRRSFSMLNFAGLKANDTWKYAGMTKDYTMKISNPLKQDNDNSFGAYSEDLMFIANIWDEFMSLTIDLQADPIYSIAGINDINKKIFIYLVSKGVSVENVLLFLNQPILIELYETFRKGRAFYGSVYKLSHAIYFTANSNNIPIMFEGKNMNDTTTTTYATLEDGRILVELNPSVRRPGAVLSSQFDQATKFSKEEMEESFTKPNKELQADILKYFAIADTEAAMFSGLLYNLSADRIKDVNIYSIEDQEIALDKIKNSGFFNIEGIEKLTNQRSIYSIFNPSKTIKVLSDIFYNKSFGAGYQTMIRNILSKAFERKTVKTEMIDVIENDFLEYIYKNYYNLDIEIYDPISNTRKHISEYLVQDPNKVIDLKNKSEDKLKTLSERKMSYNFSKYFIQNIYNISKKEDFVSYGQKLKALIKRYPSLEKIQFVKSLKEENKSPMFNFDNETSRNPLDNYVASNLFFERDDNDVNNLNTLVEEFKNLMTFNPVHFLLPEEFSPEDRINISTFFTELAYLSLYQSGASNVSDNFSDLLPTDFWMFFIDTAINNYKEEMGELPGQVLSEQDQLLKAMKKRNEMKMFALMFIENNKRYNWNVYKMMYGIKDLFNPESEQDSKKRRAKEKDIQFFHNFTSGKNYSIEFNKSRFDISDQQIPC